MPEAPPPPSFPPPDAAGAGPPYGRWWLALAAVLGYFGLFIVHYKFRGEPGYDLWPLVKWSFWGGFMVCGAILAATFAAAGVGSLVEARP